MLLDQPGAGHNTGGGELVVAQMLLGLWSIPVGLAAKI